MRKTTIAVAAMMLASGAAQAQVKDQSNVVVYGLLDTSVEYLTNHDVAKNSKVRMTSGAMNTARWGLRGSEDIGGGQKVVFQLEGEIQMGANNASTTPLFNRQRNVGMEGNFGRVIFGHSYSTTYDFILPFDPMGYSPLYSWVTSGNATRPVTGSAVRKDGMVTGVSNMVKYQGKVNNVKVGVTYGMGETAGRTSAGAKFAAGAGYDIGQLNLAATVDQQNSALASNGAYDQARSIHFAASYQIDDVKILGGYRNYRKSLASGNPDLRSDMFWGGASYKMTPKLDLTGAVYYQDIRDVAAAAESDPIMYVMRAKYALSKRTSLYATAAYTHAKHGTNVSLSRDDAGFAGNQTGVALGIQHRF